MRTRQVTFDEVAKRSAAIVCFWPILLKNSLWAVERSRRRKPTSQIDPGSTIATLGKG
jgi:hypothetical protein